MEVPGEIREVSVYVVRLPEITFVTGMTVTVEGHGDCEIGYRGPAGEKTLVGSCGNGVVVGFHVVIGNWGVNALQRIFPDGSTSRWAGCPDETPISRFIVPGERIHHLNAGFDVSSLS